MASPGGPGTFLAEGPKVLLKYEADDGDIKPILIDPNDQLWAGPNPEPAGAVNDSDSARGTGSKKNQIGERARFATFKAAVTATDTGGNYSVTKVYSKKIPVLTKAAFGVTPFVRSATVTGKVYFLVIDPTTPTLASVNVTWKCSGITPEANR